MGSLAGCGGCSRWTAGGAAIGGTGGFASGGAYGFEQPPGEGEGDLCVGSFFSDASLNALAITGLPTKSFSNFSTFSAWSRWHTQLEWLAIDAYLLR